jgi:hypothetical protein
MGSGIDAERDTNPLLRGKPGLLVSASSPDAAGTRRAPVSAQTGSVAGTKRRAMRSRAGVGDLHSRDSASSAGAGRALAPGEYEVRNRSRLETRSTDGAGMATPPAGAIGQASSCLWASSSTPARLCVP